jgi:hypothetical protein
MVLPSGDFVQGNGETATDANGASWVRVTAVDGNETVQGWVSADLISPHRGRAQGPKGRYNPDLDRQGFKSVGVRPDDSLWDIADHHGVHFAKLIEVNSAHIQDPFLIFEGDRIYLPRD